MDEMSLKLGKRLWAAQRDLKLLCDALRLCAFRSTFLAIIVVREEPSCYFHHYSSLNKLAEFQVALYC